MSSLNKALSPRAKKIIKDHIGYAMLDNHIDGLLTCSELSDHFQGLDNSRQRLIVEALRNLWTMLRFKKFNDVTYYNIYIYFDLIVDSIVGKDFNVKVK